MDKSFGDMGKDLSTDAVCPMRRIPDKKSGMYKGNSAFRTPHSGLKAGFTVEAAFIVPLSMFVIITFMYMAFYMHDCVIMKTVGPYYILENADSYSDNINGIEADTKQMLEKRLIIASEVSVELTDGGGAVLECSAQFKLPFEFIRTLLGASDGSISTEIDISMLSGRENILKYNAIVDAAGSLSQ